MEGHSHGSTFKTEPVATLSQQGEQAWDRGLCPSVAYCVQLSVFCSTLLLMILQNINVLGQKSYMNQSDLYAPLTSVPTYPSCTRLLTLEKHVF